MDWEGRRIVEKQERESKRQSHRERYKKRKLLAQNFQKVGILFIPKEPPGIPTAFLLYFFSKPTYYEALLFSLTVNRDF